MSVTLALPMFAQDTQNRQSISQPAILTLEDMGSLREETLRNVFDAAVYAFGLPAEWELSEGAQLQLNITTFKDNPLEAQNQSSTMLSITFNNVLVTVIPVSSTGDETFTIDLPAEVFAQPRRDGRHELRIMVDNEECLNNAQTIIVIRNHSTFIIPYEVGKLPTDLRLLPHPLFQQSFFEDEAIVVIPDQPTEDEMRAALTVIGGFAKMSRGRLILQLVTVSDLTREMQETQHLIMTGKLESLPLLDDMTLPEALNSFRLEDLNDDGILAMAVSPFNAGRVVLAVTGATDAGVIKAAQVLSSARVRTSASSDFARIASVQPERIFNALQPLDSTLKNMGYITQTFNTVGFNSTEYTFYIPPGQQLADGAHFDLTFSHSAALNYDLSTLDVVFNDEPVSGIRLSDETSDPNTTRIMLPASTARKGINILTVNALLRGNTVCVDPRTQSLWLSVMDTSTLHLPQMPTSTITTPVYYLSRYPNPLAANPSLSQVAFVLPSDSPDTWKTAAHLAYDLGRRSRGVMIDLTVVFADNVPDEIRKNYNLVLVGQPSMLPLVSELGDAMPAPFTSDTEFALEDNLPFVYRLPANASIGYLELFPSPWNSNLVVLAVLGSTSESIQWAADALLVSNIRSTLAGNFATIENQYAFAFNTVELTRTQIVPTATEEAVIDIEQFRVSVDALQPEANAEVSLEAVPVSPYERPQWLLPAIGVISVSMAAIILSVVMYSGWQRIRSRQRGNRK